MDFLTPIDMPRSTHYGNNYYVVYSNKIHRICRFFSNLEYYNFLSLEINPLVEKFCEQPLKIGIIQDNKIQHAIFDMWVKYRDGREELQEVKYAKELSGHSESARRTQEQIRREEAWCNDNKIPFVIRTEEDFSHGRFYLANAHTIAARLRSYTASEDKFYTPRIINALSQTPLTIDKLFSLKLLPIDNEIEHICYLYEQGIVEFNINSQPLGLKTEVSLCKKLTF